MEKSLVPFGNSVGVVIDRALCRMLDVRRGSRVRVTTDGKRLLIEPVREEKKMAPLERLDLKGVVGALVYSDIPAEALARLHPGLETFRIHARAMTWATTMSRDDEKSEADVLYARRFRVCYEQVRAGNGWNAAVDAAVSSG
jgi:antitoxin component of MazEF toxin-antitoxin module